SAIPLISAGDQADIGRWNATAAAFSHDKFVHELFEARAIATPDAPAIVWQGSTISYAALDVRSNSIAHAMAARGAGPGKLVGLHLTRGPDMVASLLAVLKTGAGYVPLDPSYPQDRLDYMVEDAALTLLITDTSLPATVATLPLSDLPTAAGRVTMPAQSTEAVAYVIYTSGSTGKPKGVQVPHRSAVNFLETMAARPGFTAKDRVVAVTTLSFDIAVNELLLPLSIGAAIVLASKEEAGDGQLLARLLDGSGATTMQATPATWRMLIDAGWHGPAGFKALAGGEALSADLANALLERCSELWNMYGPTETTVWSTCCRIDDLSRAISIGAPIANTSIRVLDEAGNECPVGVPGEIWIGGDGVTLGYLRRPELTAERFVPDRFSTAAKALLYRTGDRGRWRADGMVEHLGRLDFQVKVRGYRIELGEIESAIGGHPGVARAVVIVREDRKGDVRLVAYVVPRASAVTDTELGAHVRKTLPEYMVPQHVVTLPTIPLLPNGKVDRKSLPAPVIEARSERAFVAPRTPMESTVAAAMASFLALPEIGVHDDFFAMGGHSLLASQLTARLARELNLQVPMRAVFEAATPEALARWVENEQKKGGKSRWSVPRRADQSTAPLSAMQQRMWFVEQLDPGQPVNNSPSAHRLRGALDEQAFNRAFGAMVARQHGLRTSIEMDGDTPVQVIHDHIEPNLLPAHDLRAQPRDMREKTMMAEIVAAIRTPFDLSVAPLYRAKLYRLDDEEYVFFFMPHHIVWDGWSFDLLYHDMAALYGAFREGKPSPLPELAVSYGDFSAWHAGWMESDEMTEEVRHWKERLAGHTEPLALPPDYPRPDLLAGNAKMLWLPVSAETVAATRELARQADATLFMTLLSVYVLMLSQATGQRDLVIATPVRGRQVEELEPIMGFFVNALPLRLGVRENITFLELLADVKSTVLDSFKHPDVPFERLVRELDLPRDNSRTPIYQTMFSYQDARKRILRWGNLDRERVEVMQPGVAGDMNLWCVELQKGLLFGFSYAPEILSDASAVVLRDRYMHLLNQLLTAPATRIDALPLPGTEAAQLGQWNATRTAHDRGLSVHAMTAAAAAVHGDAVAIRHGEATISHCELDQRANRIANALVARGVGRGQLVGLCVERGIGMVAAQLGILKSGAAYVPLDPAYPLDRISFMVDDAAMPLIVAEPATAAQFGWPAAKVLLLDDTREASANDPAVASQPADAAYVIYTSGSTGKPKGVIVPHGAVVNFLHTMRDKPGLAAGDRMLAVTTLSFDIAVLELLLPLTVGATVVMADREQALDGHALSGLIAASDANVMQATPATWRLLLDAGWQGGAGFKALIGGEALSIDLALKLQSQVGELWNMYGPTETTVWSTCWKVEHPERGIVIGKPIANTTVHVLDEQRRPCPLGAAGEIWIGGEGVATGYHQRPDLTAERFIADPFSSEPGARLYRTGDRGRWRADGLIEHLGRLDFQVKVRGYRIELGEIETCMAAFPGVKQAVVLAREDVPGDVRLVAYLAAASLDVQALRDHARRTLPAYMVPQHFVSLAAIPLLPNGKIDRKALPKPSETTPATKSAASHMPPTTETEKVLAEIWADLLKISDINADDNFFDIGGHSLLGMQAIAIMQTKTGKRVNPRRYIFETLAQIARGYDEAETATAEKPGTLKRFLSKLVGGGKGNA
ncbi:MAG: amino acid adenylation domain-containing protein, partial [Betaproteobacteria bacterium]|nr:amino acid adenylation domain-containing protein [Betaproteobacteria bacterium]